MASYTQGEIRACLEELDKTYANVDVYIRESIKDAAKVAMASVNKDTKQENALAVSNAITAHIRKHFSDNGNIIMAHALGFSPLAKTNLYHAEHSNAQLLAEITNEPPMELFVTLSCGSKLQLGTGNTSATVVATLSGGADPEGKPVTTLVECSTADSITRISDTEWHVVLSMTGIHVVIASTTDPTGLKTVKTAMVQVVGSSQSSGTSSGQFTDAKFDSGWSDFVSGCYISSLTFSLAIGSGHSSSNDYLVILGKKSDGTVVILHDKFNANNRFKTIKAGAEVGNSTYTRGNLRAETHAWKNDPYTLEDDIRQVRYICETPDHADCASKATISFETNYTYDSSLS